MTVRIIHQNDPDMEDFLNRIESISKYTNQSNMSYWLIAEDEKLIGIVFVVSLPFWIFFAIPMVQADKASKDMLKDYEEYFN